MYVSLDWYWELGGETEYDKLIEFRRNDLKRIRISARSKRWWDKKKERSGSENRWDDFSFMLIWICS